MMLPTPTNFYRPRSCVAGLLLCTAPLVAQWPGADVRGDFDGNGIVDMSDVRQLRDAFGSDDALFDLNADGEVGFGDFFEMAQLVDPSRVIDPTAVEPAPLLYRIIETSQSLSLHFEQYSVTLQHGRPFGLTSLRMTGQPGDFVHSELPLADWEWFWFDVRTGRRDVKLLQPTWIAPRAETHPGHVEVTYRRRNVLLEGIDLRVSYRFYVQRPVFHVTYQIDNTSRQTISEPYVMLGFPGFPNQPMITGVSDTERHRTARWGNFGDEALSDGRTNYLLLRHDAARRPQGMRGGLEMHTQQGLYTLTTYYLADPQVRRAYTAHTNKPRYLTSHLYVTLADLPPQRSHQLRIHYIMAGPPTQ
ncbi:MAG: hypothetical protein CME13_19945 [Gemmatimonadetes bacterium]|nr:hypothetical protein [Gemmatimonadota bacterium]